MLYQLHNFEFLYKIYGMDANHHNHHLFHIIPINIAKVRTIFSISMPNWVEKIHSKKILIIFWKGYRLIPTLKYLTIQL